MKRRFLGMTVGLAMIAVPTVATTTWQPAMPGRLLTFPADHASHPGYKTEWWYYTGHLTTTHGRHYGYELTFFRQGVEPTTKPQNAWQANQIHLAHFAVTDVDGRQFRFGERINRPGLGIAGADTTRYRSWNDDWVAEDLGGTHHLSASGNDLHLDVLLDSLKPPVLHGDRGYSRKGTCASCASHYYSLTRMQTKGYLTVGKQTEPVTGMSWMDHEFGSGQLDGDQRGWDWFSVQMDDHTELMIYRLRRRDGSIVPQSSGTVVAADGSYRHLSMDQVTIRSAKTWHSAASQATYPIDWTIQVPTQGLNVVLSPAVLDQELRTAHSTGVTYWEGAVTVRGTRGGKPVSGQGYVEMTGYAPADKPRF